jgi:hypothetical protein
MYTPLSRLATLAECSYRVTPTKRGFGNYNPLRSELAEKPTFRELIGDILPVARPEALGLIDKAGKWWKGSEPNDIKEYLEAFASDAYLIHEFRSSICNCGGDGFYLLTDDGEGCAKRVCASCGVEHLLCDSEEYWQEARPVEWTCIECSSKIVNVGVGFSLYEDGEIRWLYVGERCTQCQNLGCVTQWKVAYSPSRQLLEKV